MKSIILSVQPKWLEKILNGEKTIEIRKTNPKCELPIDVYLYCGKGTNGSSLCIFKNRDIKIGFMKDHYNYDETDIVLDGLVVAKFTLKKVDETTAVDLSTRGFDIRKKSCLDVETLIKYAGGFSKTDTQLYAWYIDNLVIFDKPKELSEFKRWVGKTIYCGMDCPPYQDEVLINITKAPQSYCYCEVEENI